MRSFPVRSSRSKRTPPLAALPTRTASRRASRSQAASKRYNMQLRFTFDTAVPIPAIAQAQRALPQSARPSPTMAGGLQRAEYARHLA